MQLLLLSNSTCSGQGYLEHARDQLTSFLAGISELTFVPYALADWDAYTATATGFFSQLGITVTGSHRMDARQLAASQAFFVGGGNTFRLVKQLHDSGSMAEIRAAVASGAKYVGSSAGTNIAAPTLRTTNDMPIVQPTSFETLRLVPFQINPHYLDPREGDLHMGETREERLVQFLEENDATVIGIREGTWLHRDGSSLQLGGGHQGARIFRRGDIANVEAPADLSEHLRDAARFDTA